MNPAGPRGVYDEGKRYAEAITIACGTKFGLDVRIIRIFNTYLPRMDPEDGRVVTNPIVQALRGEPLTICIAAMMKVKCHKPVSLGNPEEYTILQLAEPVKELTGVALPLDFRPLPCDNPRQRRPDISLANRLLGWRPFIGVREGLRRTIEHFRLELGENTKAGTCSWQV